MTIDEIRGLANLEREMDAGTQPYVVNQGLRWPFPPELMARCGIESGQKISDGLMMAIMEANLALLREKIEAQEWPAELETDARK